MIAIKASTMISVWTLIELMIVEWWKIEKTNLSKTNLLSPPLVS